MIKITSNSNRFTAYFEADADVGVNIVYLGTGIALAISGDALTRYTIMIYDSYHLVSFDYMSDPGGSLQLDTRNLFIQARGASVSNYCWMRISSERISDTSITDLAVVGLSVVGGISLNAIWAPYGRGCSGLIPEAEDPHQVTPPNVIWADPDAAASLLIENTLYTDLVWRQVVGATQPALNHIDYTMAPDQGATAIYARRDEGFFYWNFKVKGDCDTLIYVAWVSRLGGKKAAYFPVVSRINDMQMLELDTFDNSFSSLKNRNELYRCRLDGLTPYSLWYYQDLLFSPSVYATLDYGMANLGSIIGSGLLGATVMGDTAEVKAGYDMRSFEFVIKLRRYDTF